MRKEAVMTTAPTRYQVSLDHQGLFDIADASGVTVRCDKGSVWLTLDNDPRDFVLEPGEVFQTDEHRHALVYALNAATITLRTPTRPQSAAQPGGARTPARLSFGLRATA
jgi:DUF2917 family protein